MSDPYPAAERITIMLRIQFRCRIRRREFTASGCFIFVQIDLVFIKYRVVIIMERHIIYRSDLFKIQIIRRRTICFLFRRGIAITAQGHACRIRIKRLIRDIHAFRIRYLDRYIGCTVIKCFIGDGIHSRRKFYGTCKPAVIKRPLRYRYDRGFVKVKTGDIFAPAESLFIQFADFFSQFHRTLNG